jgi:hypothetical protein
MTAVHDCEADAVELRALRSRYILFLCVANSARSQMQRASPGRSQQPM